MLNIMQLTDNNNGTKKSRSKIYNDFINCAGFVKVLNKKIHSLSEFPNNKYDYEDKNKAKNFKLNLQNYKKNFNKINLLVSLNDFQNISKLYESNAELKKLFYKNANDAKSIEYLESRNKLQKKLCKIVDDFNKNLSKTENLRAFFNILSSYFEISYKNKNEMAEKIFPIWGFLLSLFAKKWIKLRRKCDELSIKINYVDVPEFIHIIFIDSFIDYFSFHSVKDGNIITNYSKQDNNENNFKKYRRICLAAIIAILNDKSNLNVYKVVLQLMREPNFRNFWIKELNTTDKIVINASLTSWNDLNLSESANIYKELTSLMKVYNRLSLIINSGQQKKYDLHYEKSLLKIKNIPIINMNEKLLTLTLNSSKATQNKSNKVFIGGNFYKQEKDVFDYKVVELAATLIMSKNKKQLLNDSLN